MSPLGIQRTVAVIIFLSPWIFTPGIFKEVVFVIAGVLLFISTLDLKKKQRVVDENTTSVAQVNA